ncbi:MAG: ATP-binding protein [Bacteroidota bacterium]
MITTSKHENSQKDQARIVAINVFGIGISAMLTLYALYFLFIGNIELAYVLAFIILICLLPPLLNYLKYHKAARFLYNFNAAPFIYYHVYLIGPGMGIELFMILTFSYPFIFLKRSESKWMIFFFIYNTIFLFLTGFVPLSIIEAINLSEVTTTVVKVSIYVFCCLHAGIFYYLYYKSIDTTEKELINSKNAAEKASIVKQEFLASMSHEIRTPLNVVVSIADMLSGKDAKPEKELINSLKFSSDHLMKVINEILDFSKLEAGKIELDKNPVNLRDCIQNLFSAYKISANEKKLSLNIEIDQSIESVFMLDELRLNQILGNLLNNALKFTHEGSVSLKVELIKESADDQLIKLSISDTGIGIPKEKLSSIFSSFTQLSANITKKYGGSGLGLNIVVGLLKLFNSELLVESEVGKGSVFSFELLLEKSGIDQTEESIEAPLKPLKILVVEDYQLNAFIIQKMLENWGMHIDIVESGKEAIARIQQKTFDIILMDIHMPEMDGIETTEQIKVMEKFNHIPIYALTADITAGQQKNVKSLFDGFLRKPLEKDKLKEVLALCGESV